MALDWSIFCADTIEQQVQATCLGFGRNQTYLGWLLEAWGQTVLVAVLSLVVALLIGTVIGVARTLPDTPHGKSRIARWANLWVEFFRNIPLLVQVILWYHVVPVVFPLFADTPKLLLVVMGLGFFTSARIAEQVRAGIQALPRGQRYAGMALGFSTWQTYRYVLLPMAFRIIVPPLTSEGMNIFKNSSVAFAVSITELTFFAQQVAEETSRGIEVYLAVTSLYIISAFAINRLMAMVEKRVRVPGFVASTGGGH
jgi:glutamate/aspartate transport system permease protein